MRYDKPSALWLTDPILEKETGVDPESGRLRQMNNALVNFIPVPVTEGSVLHISRADLNCSVYYYSKQIPEDLIHTYAYDPESNWSTYRADWCIEKASEPEVVLKHEGYITYYKMSDLSRKWTDSDIANLTYISKAMELAINDQ